MKLAAIYNVFDGEELLEQSIRQIRLHVDVVILVYQTVSNWGETRLLGAIKCRELTASSLANHSECLNPRLIGGWRKAQRHEITKRQVGIELARGYDCTHFLHLDCDEFYHAEEFGAAKEWIAKRRIEGSVCRVWTYFKSPTLRFSRPDSTLVPFIHLLHRTTKTGVRKYPHYCDLTRRINAKSVVVVDPALCTMHHMSWVRRDIRLKLRNSTARDNLKRTSLYNDYLNAEPGYHVREVWNEVLEYTPSSFNISI
jgi:hypothetical protein